MLAPFTVEFHDVIIFQYNGGNTLMKRSILFRNTLILAISLIFGSVGFSLEARYPTKVIDRPSVLPENIFSMGLDAGLENLQTLNFSVNTKLGLGKNLEAQLSWNGLAIDTKAKEDKLHIKRIVNLGLKYNFLGVPHVSQSITLNVPLHIYSGEILREFSVGTPIVFYNQHMAGGLLGDLFTLTMRKHIAARFDFKWWYGAQIYGNLWADLSGSFGHVTLNSDKNLADVEAKAFWQELPLSLGVIYAFNNYFDLGANAGFSNVLKAKDTFNFGLTFTARAGRLFG